MAKRGRRSKAAGDTETGVESTIVSFAEDLGRILGTAQRKAEDWMNQRQAITEQLTQIRDTASKYLDRLTGAGAGAIGVIRRRRGRPRTDTGGGDVPASFGAPPATAGGGRKRKRRGMSAEAREKIRQAQLKRWAKQRKTQG